MESINKKNEVWHRINKDNNNIPVPKYTRLIIILIIV